MAAITKAPHVMQHHRAACTLVCFNALGFDRIHLLPKGMRWLLHLAGLKFHKTSVHTGYNPLHIFFSLHNYLFCVILRLFKVISHPGGTFCVVPCSRFFCSVENFPIFVNLLIFFLLYFVLYRLLAASRLVAGILSPLSLLFRSVISQAMSAYLYF